MRGLATEVSLTHSIRGSSTLPLFFQSLSICLSPETDSNLFFLNKLGCRDAPLAMCRAVPA